MAISFVKQFSLMSSSPGRIGYANSAGQPDTLSDTEDDDRQMAMPLGGYGDREIAFNSFEQSSSAGYRPEHGAAFSLLTPSMWPQDLLAALSEPEHSQPPFQFDAFGFIIENAADAASTKSTPSDDVTVSSSDDDQSAVRSGGHAEDQLRTKFIAYLEFNYNEAAIVNMKWSQVGEQIRHTKVLDELVKGGLPHSMRTQLWLRFSNGAQLRSKSRLTYAEMCEHSNHVESLSDELISRILPSNACFMRSTSVGIERLRRLLRVMKWLSRSGSQPTSSHETVNVAIIAAYLLLISDEEDAFWLLLSCASELKSCNHQSILKCFIHNHCPDADTILKSNDIEISLISCHWFSTIFATFIPDTELLFRQVQQCDCKFTNCISNTRLDFGISTSTTALSCYFN